MSLRVDKRSIQLRAICYMASGCEYLRLIISNNSISNKISKLEAQTDIIILAYKQRNFIKRILNLGETYKADLSIDNENKNHKENAGFYRTENTQSKRNTDQRILVAYCIIL